MAFSESTGNNGIIMGADGINMSGTWQNPATGHKFTVRDTFFQDGQLVVQDTTGRMYDYNMIQNYVQVTDGQGNNINLPTQTPRTGIQKQKEEIPAEVANLILDESGSSAIEESYLTEEDKKIMAGLGNINTPVQMAPSGERGVVAPVVVPEPKKSVTDPDYEMIDRVLKRHSIPELNADLSWPKVPQKQIETLVDILGVEPESIANYYIGKLDKDAIFEVVKNGITLYINELLSGESTVEEKVEDINAAPLQPVIIQPYNELIEPHSEGIVTAISTDGPGEPLIMKEKETAPKKKKVVKTTKKKK